MGPGQSAFARIFRSAYASERLRRAHYAVLGGSVHGVSWMPDQAAVGGHVQDHPAVRVLQQVRQDVLAPQEDAPEVDRDDPIEVLSGAVQDRANHCDAGVVEDDVQLAVSLDGAAHQPPHLGAGSCVRPRECRRAVRPYLLGRPLPGRLVHVREQDPHSHPNGLAAASPTPEASPVITATLPSSRTRPAHFSGRDLESKNRPTGRIAPTLRLFINVQDIAK